MGLLWLVGSIKLQVFFAKEPYKRDNILQKRPIILRSLLIVATPYPVHRGEFESAPAGASQECVAEANEYEKRPMNSCDSSVS